jgi:two-component system response regulator NreC
MKKKIRVLVADDHQIVREGLVLLVNSQPDMMVVAEAADGREACQRARALKPDVAVLDLSMPRMNGVKAAQALRRDCPQVKVLALTMHDDEHHLRELVKAKAAGYVLKRAGAEELLQAIRTVASRGVYFDLALATKALCDELARTARKGKRGDGELTEREETVLRLIAWGQTNKEIAAKLSLSPKTIEAYKLRLGKKLGLHGRTEMVRYALRRGWLNLDDGDSLGEAKS